MAENRNGIISTVAMFAFGWDIPDGGAERLFAKAAANGITRVYITSVYHAGYFLQTHHHLSRVYMVEDGAASFAGAVPTILKVNSANSLMSDTSIRP